MNRLHVNKNKSLLTSTKSLNVSTFNWRNIKKLKKKFIKKFLLIIGHASGKRKNVDFDFFVVNSSC